MNQSIRQAVITNKYEGSINLFHIRVNHAESTTMLNSQLKMNVRIHYDAKLRMDLPFFRSLRTG